MLNNTIKPEMKPKQIFEMHPEEHGKWEYTNWTNNLLICEQHITKIMEEWFKTVCHTDMIEQL